MLLFVVLNYSLRFRTDKTVASFKYIVRDFFRKIVVLDGNRKLWKDEDGVIYIGVIPFMLNDILNGMI